MCQLYCGDRAYLIRPNPSRFHESWNAIRSFRERLSLMRDTFMVVKLRVMHGPNAGKEIKIPVTQFVIGRDDDCHLRPRSDAVSRKHCVIAIHESTVMVRDLGSRNGTFINGDRVEGDRPVKVGDHLRIGPLEFEVLIDHGLGGDKRPSVNSIQEAAARTFDSRMQDTDVSSWLEELDSKDKQRKANDPETRQFKLDELPAAETPTTALRDTTLNQKPDQPTVTDSVKAAKKEPGKLPPKTEQATATSRDAATEMLKKFFNRR